MTRVRWRIASISRSTTANGSSIGVMKTRPITLMTPTGAAVARLRHVRSAARHAGGVVRRPEQPRLGGDVVERFLLVPDVIARRHHVDAPFEQRVADVARDAEPGGRVLRVRNREIDVVVLDERGAVPCARGRARAGRRCRR